MRAVAMRKVLKYKVTSRYVLAFSSWQEEPVAFLCGDQIMGTDNERAVVSG